MKEGGGGREEEGGRKEGGAFSSDSLEISLLIWWEDPFLQLPESWWEG